MARSPLSPAGVSGVGRCGQRGGGVVRAAASCTHAIFLDLRNSLGDAVLESVMGKCRKPHCVCGHEMQEGHAARSIYKSWSVRTVLSITLLADRRKGWP